MEITYLNLVEAKRRGGDARHAPAQVPTTAGAATHRFADAALMYAVILAERARRVSSDHLLASLYRGTPSQAQDVLGELVSGRAMLSVSIARPARAAVTRTTRISHLDATQGTR